MLKLTAATAALCLMLSAAGCAERPAGTGGAADPGAAGGVTDRTGTWGTEQRTAPATDAGTFGQHQGTGAAPVIQPGTAHDPHSAILGPGTGTATEPGDGAKLGTEAQPAR